jgi:hypothetical protein
MIGNSAVAGTDAAICAIGCAMADSLGLKPRYNRRGNIQRQAAEQEASLFERQVS